MVIKGLCALNGHFPRIISVKQVQTVKNEPAKHEEVTEQGTESSDQARAPARRVGTKTCLLLGTRSVFTLLQEGRRQQHLEEEFSWAHQREGSWARGNLGSQHGSRALGSGVPRTHLQALRRCTPGPGGEGGLDRQGQAPPAVRHCKEHL